MQGAIQLSIHHEVLHPSDPFHSRVSPGSPCSCRWPQKESDAVRLADAREVRACWALGVGPEEVVHDRLDDLVDVVIRWLRPYMNQWKAQKRGMAGTGRGRTVNATEMPFQSPESSFFEVQSWKPRRCLGVSSETDAFFDFFSFGGHAGTNRGWGVIHLEFHAEPLAPRAHQRRSGSQLRQPDEEPRGMKKEQKRRAQAPIVHRQLQVSSRSQMRKPIVSLSLSLLSPQSVWLLPWAQHRVPRLKRCVPPR